MPAHLDDDVVGVALGIVLLIFICLFVRFRERWAVAIGPSDEDDRGITLPVSGHSQDGPFAADRGGDLTIWNTDGPGGWRSGTKKMTCKPYAIFVDGLQGEAQMEAFFILESTRSEGQTQVRLTVDQIDFGIKTCCKRDRCMENRSCERNYDEFFIKKVTITVCPDAWAQECQRLVLEPHVTPEEFQLQHSSIYGFQLPLVNPREALITYQAGNTIGRRVASFAWAPASRDSDCNSVTWTWELSRFADGTTIRFNKIYWGTRPQLGFPPASIQLHPRVNACWHLPCNVELQMPETVWDMTIITEIAVVKTKKRLRGHFVTDGPTLTYNERLAFI